MKKVAHVCIKTRLWGLFLRERFERLVDSFEGLVEGIERRLDGARYVISIETSRLYGSRHAISIALVVEV